MGDDKESTRRHRERTPVFIKAHDIRNLLCPLRTFFGAIHDSREWDFVITEFAKDCTNTLGEIEKALSDLEKLLQGNEAFHIRNLVCHLGNFFQAIEDRKQWDVIIPAFQKECADMVEEIDGVLLKLEAPETTQGENKQ